MSSEVLDLLPFLLSIDNGMAVPHLAPFLSVACSSQAAAYGLSQDVWRDAVMAPTCLKKITGFFRALISAIQDMWSEGKKLPEMKVVFDEARAIACFLNELVLGV